MGATIAMVAPALSTSVHQNAGKVIGKPRRVSETYSYSGMADVQSGDLYDEEEEERREHAFYKAEVARRKQAALAKKAAIEAAKLEKCTGEAKPCENNSFQKQVENAAITGSCDDFRRWMKRDGPMYKTPDEDFGTGWTPLMYAADAGQSELCQLLVGTFGASCDAKCGGNGPVKGLTALGIARLKLQDISSPHSRTESHKSSLSHTKDHARRQMLTVDALEALESIHRALENDVLKVKATMTVGEASSPPLNALRPGHDITGGLCGL